MGRYNLYAYPVNSMSPLVLMAFFHLGLEKTSEGPIYRPSQSISLDNSAFNYGFTLEHPMKINPDAFPQNFNCDIVGVFVTLHLCPKGITPEPITTAVCVLGQSSSTYSQL